MLVIFVEFYTILVKYVMPHSNKSKSQNVFIDANFVIKISFLKNMSRVSKANLKNKLNIL